MLDEKIPHKEKRTKRGKQLLKWIAVEVIRSSILAFKQQTIIKPNKVNFNPFKQPLMCDECWLRKLLNVTSRRSLSVSAP